MKITMSYSGGTYRGIQLASEFDKRGYLKRLFIPYYSQKHPYVTRLLGKFEDKQYIDNKRVKTNLKILLFRKILFKSYEFRNAHRLRFRYRYRIGDIIDKWVAKHISAESSDLIIVESHQALHTIRKAKELGIVTFLDRTNSHIKIQERIDTEEFRNFDLPSWHDYKDTERGLREYEEVDYIIVPSTFVKKGFIDENIIANKILQVSPGIDLSYFKQIEKNDNIFRIIYCGGIMHRKGIFYLLEALSSLKLKNMELYLIGNVDKSMKDILEKHTGYYKLIGFVANYELYKYFSQGSVFVFPSLEDSFGKVILEAMACGLPVIVTTNTAADDVVRENVDGFIIPIRDVEALKEKILYMYENPDLCREMGQNAMKRVHEKYTLESYADRMLEALGAVSRLKG